MAWLSPLNAPGGAVPGSPVLSPEDVATIRAPGRAPANLHAATERMKRFYANTTERREDHNHLRITRIIRSLRLLVGDGRADEFRAPIRVCLVPIRQPSPIRRPGSAPPPSSRRTGAALQGGTQSGRPAPTSSGSSTASRGALLAATSRHGFRLSQPPTRVSEIMGGDPAVEPPLTTRPPGAPVVTGRRVQLASRYVRQHPLTPVARIWQLAHARSPRCAVVVFSWAAPSLLAARSASKSGSGHQTRP